MLSIRTLRRLAGVLVVTALSAVVLTGTATSDSGQYPAARKSLSRPTQALRQKHTRRRACVALRPCHCLSRGRGKS